jgi:hypothetical protein
MDYLFAKNKTKQNKTKQKQELTLHLQLSHLQSLALFFYFLGNPGPPKVFVFINLLLHLIQLPMTIPTPALTLNPKATSGSTTSCVLYCFYSFRPFYSDTLASAPVNTGGSSILPPSIPVATNSPHIMPGAMTASFSWMDSLGRMDDTLAAPIHNSSMWRVHLFAHILVRCAISVAFLTHF